MTIWSNLADIGRTAGTFAKNKWNNASLSFSNWLQEPTNGVTGKWFQGTTNADALNAGITGVFTTLGTLAGAMSSSKIMRYYEQQEKAYIQNAEEQARRIQLKGDITLRNLRIKNTIDQGKQELAAAAGGGRLSGSNLDMLVQDYKVHVMDERTSSLQTLWEVENTRRAGYIQAINVAGQAMAQAYKGRNQAIAGLGKGLAAAVRDLSADAKSNMEINYQRQGDEWAHTTMMKALLHYYGAPTATTAAAVYSTNEPPEIRGKAEILGQDRPVLREKDYIEGQSIPWSFDPTLQAQYNEASSTGLLPLIQVNADGTPTVTKMFR